MTRIPGGPRIGAPLFVAGFIASLVAGAALARNTLFLPAADAAQLRLYYSTSGTAVWVSALLQLAAATGLLMFADSADRRARPAGRLAAAAFAGAAVLSVTLAAVASSAGDGTLLLLARLTLALGGPVHLAGLAGLLWFGSRAALADDRSPRWTARFGTVAAPLLLVPLLSLAIPAVTRVEPLWRLLAAVRLLAAARRPTTAADR
ncbi:hypothetical protein ACFYNO_31335 [Kitasatospora sp. NPDC006697]|uniref:hypothetical protein n=1 Tax=Kitasatospora sp. NPDC006697 TaxID=3364020 RepID=UPI00367CE336